MNNQRTTRFRAFAILTLLLLNSPFAKGQEAFEGTPRWWKGNLHTHSLWSDGNDFPEMIAAWYFEHGYNFLALSDHNILSAGQKWMAIEDVERRGGGGVVERYRRKFGLAWLEQRESEGENGEKKSEIRLKPLDEFRALVEKAGSFIMIQGEEISDKAEGKPIHMNATNVAKALKPVGGASVEETIRNNLRMVLEHELEEGRQVLPHLNHPNFGYAVTAEDLARVIEERFFEVFNGHPGVNQLGDESHLAIEPMWDVINAIRLFALEAEPIYGIATDDSHEYHGRPGSQPGRAWVMVRAAYLTPEHLIRAMKAGEFYASSGVTLNSITFDESDKTLRLDIEPVKSAEYSTDFIVLPAPADTAKVDVSSLPQARVAASVAGLSPTYQLKAGEAYVRAIVRSSLAHPNPSLDQQVQQAWVQPYGWRKPGASSPQMPSLVK